MDIIRLSSQAKINLFLDINGVREDGYHEIFTVMQSISLCDRVKLEKTAGKIGLYCNLPYVPNDERNIAYKAAELFFETTGIAGGVFITIRKKIPVGAGLAGGSGNAAAVLSGLNTLYDARLSNETLCEMGLKIGADLPFCLTGGTVVATGIGESLKKIADFSDSVLLIAKPRRSISTPQVYKAYDCTEQHSHSDGAAFVAAIEKGERPHLFNVLEGVTGAICKDVPKILECMKAHGGDAIMSGSGTAVFGFFDSEAKLESCKAALRAASKGIFLSRAHTVPYALKTKDV